jgi:putative transposase
LRDQGEEVSENWAARLASIAGILAQIGYKHRPGRYGGKPAAVASNTLDRQFDVDALDTVWVSAHQIAISRPSLLIFQP